MVYDVNLRLISKSQHNSMVVTGFHLLQKAGIVRLTICPCYDMKNDYPHETLVEALVQDKKIAFDNLDGYNWDVKRMELYLDGVDSYFKRSFSVEKNLQISATNREKIHPLGFNYHVTYPGNPFDARPFFRGIVRKIIDITKGLSLSNTVESFEQEPDYKKDDLKILFLTRLWEPPRNDDSTDNGMNEREYINEMRIQIISKLKSKYGMNFIGGIADSDFSRSICPALIVSSALSNKKAYINTMKASDICIASMGLHESIGWKTGEYVAASRAIVAEEHRYDVVGDFLKSQNYISYNTAEQCIDAVDYLYNNPDKVYEMKKANAAYYRKYLRPDNQVLFALQRAIGERDSE